MHIKRTDHLETDILCPLPWHKRGQPHTHSTTKERGSPKITTLLEPGATSDFMSAAARLIYSRSALSTPTAAQETHLRPPPPTARSPFYLLNIYTIPHPLHTSHIYRPDSAPELLVVLSAIDKGGQTEIQANRLHKHSWTVRVLLSEVTGCCWDKGWMISWATFWQTRSIRRQRTGWWILKPDDKTLNRTSELWFSPCADSSIKKICKIK